MDGILNLANEWKSFLILYAPKIVAAVATLIIGIWLASFFTRLATKKLFSKHFTPTLRSFLTSMIKFTLIAMVVLSAASTAGIAITSFVAIIGAAGLAVGLALQGNLANFASGILILIFRPFDVGDEITSQGQTGIVESIQLIYTVLINQTGSMVIIPNNLIFNTVVINNTRTKKRLSEITITVSSDNDPAAVRTAAIEILKQNPLIDQAYEPEVLVADFTHEKIVFLLRVWTPFEHQRQITSDVRTLLLMNLKNYNINLS